jgi:hypothetical protein
MAKPFSSRDEMDDTQKINPRQSGKYQPLPMTDESVYNLAQHYYTAEEIAERFRVTRETLLKLHGEAYNKGKDEAFQKPRMLLGRIFKAFDMLEDSDFARGDVPVNNLLNAIKLHAQKYEGLGSTQTVITKTEEKPSASDIRFTPLKGSE